MVILAIVGSRTVNPSIEAIDAAVAQYIPGGRDVVVEVVCGLARGGDEAGDRWAKHHGIPVHYEPITEEDMRVHGKYLGPRQRNRRIAQRATDAIAFWDACSGGTPDFVTRMVCRNKPVHVIPTAPTRRVRDSKPRTKAPSVRPDPAGPPAAAEPDGEGQS